MRGVFVWQAHEGLEAEFERRWRLGSQLFQTFPGAQGTRLHRSVDLPRTYLGFASWESLAYREAAAPHVQAAELADPDNLSVAPISDVLYAGFFEEPFDEVLPP